jgi:hypothetical protein
MTQSQSLFSYRQFLLNTPENSETVKSLVSRTVRNPQVARQCVFCRGTKAAVTDFGWSRQDMSAWWSTISTQLAMANVHNFTSFTDSWTRMQKPATWHSLINSSTAKVRVSLIFGCERRDNSLQEQTKFLWPKWHNATWQTQSKEGVLQIILQSNNLLVLVLRTLHKGRLCPHNKVL